LRGTIWRYHPQRKIVEALSSGTTNPWGHDWNEHGELFFINTVNGHLWHDFAGAHFVRPHTFDPNPPLTRSSTSTRTTGISTRRLGGKNHGMARQRPGRRPRHVGMMIYQGDNWPAGIRGGLFTLNLHGRRANQEILERNGSGYVAKHGPDCSCLPEPWFLAA